MKQQQATLFPDVADLADQQPDDGLRTKARASEQYLSSIWSFPGSGGSQLYRWYGTLPRPLVERLISLYTSNDQPRVLDPFMGLGITLDVAAHAGLSAIGIDSNPLACLAAEARLYDRPDTSETLKIATGVVSNSVRVAGHSADANKNHWQRIVADEKFQYTKKWFREDTLYATLALLWRIAQVDDIAMQRLFFVASAQVIRDVASVDPRCTHHLVTKHKPFIDPVPLWYSQVSQILSSVPSVPADPARISVKQGSALDNQLPKESADFVLAHPPYLGVIHYHLIHRLATDLLDIVKSNTAPISLQKYDFDHSKLKKADVSTDSTHAYKLFVQQFASTMQQIVSPDGRCVVIIGDQRHKGHLRHPFTDFIYWFEECGFTLEELFVWVLQNNGGMHVLRRGHFIDHNYILVFHKEKRI